MLSTLPYSAFLCMHVCVITSIVIYMELKTEMIRNRKVVHEANTD